MAKEDLVGEKKDLDLSSLTTAEGLVLPEKIGGDLALSSLKGLEGGLVLPKTLPKGPEDLKLPETMKGLEGGLVLPKTLPKGPEDLKLEGKLIGLEGGLVLPETLPLPRVPEYLVGDKKDLDSYLSSLSLDELKELLVLVHQSKGNIPLEDLVQSLERGGRKR